ncbi:MAG: Gfo/Idh/MocA family oxidoreductase [Clostridiales bacterium]|nr:Gfo/Idh/MocA family oxidoreductase [Candidatus Equinaster intestinalis]
MEKKLRLGIIGIGNMGSGHVRNLEAGKCPEIELTAVADIDADRLAWAKDFVKHEIGLFGSAEEMLDSGLIDAVIVAVPHYDHPKYAIMAMEKGIAVMVEKPAGVYTKQVKEMIAVADKTKVPFGLMMNQRTHPIYRKMREIVKSGVMGEIRRTNWIITEWYRPNAYYASGDWRATWSGEGGGVLLNQCPHNLDIWQWICGTPVKVSAHLGFGKWHDIEVEDDVTAYVEYENGATGVFVTTTGDNPGTNRFEIDFEKGKLVAENGRLYQWLSEYKEQDWSATTTDPFGRAPYEYKEIPVEGEATNHPGVLNAFADHILHGGEMVADAREGLKAVSISNAMHFSQWTGKPVSIPFDDDAYYEELKKHIATSRRKTNVVKVIKEDMSSTF